MGNFINGIIDKKINRRNFLKASAVGAASLALPGCSSNTLTKAGADASSANSEEKWITAACWHNCGGRCLNKALVVDGVVLRQKTDDTHPDSLQYPQQRGCLRGRSQRQQVFGADRLKYPMKRKHWEPGGGDKSLRGKDEWVRISWEEALDAVAGEITRIYDKFGPTSVLARKGNATLKLLRKKGGYITIWDSNSEGTYNLDVKKLGIPDQGYDSANDRFDLKNAETIVLYGSNPAMTSAGSPSWYFMEAKKAGTEFICVGPAYTNSAAVFDAKWIHVRPGTDTAFLLAVAYTMITEDDPIKNPIIDWDFLNRCTVGFDAEHMPAGAKLNENFKDYVLGKYDNQPKTPEWATEICGTPVEDIQWYARKIRKGRKVSLLHGFAPARNRNAENFPQLFLTIGAMGGHIGKPGEATGQSAHTNAANSGPSLVKPGSDGLPSIPNPINEYLMAPVAWKSVLEGKYNSVGQWEFSKNIKDLDIHMIYWEDGARFQTTPDLMGGIEAHRKVDFVVANAQFLKTEAKYADIVLPVTTPWENAGGGLLDGNREILIAYSQVTEPLYEAKSDIWIGKELAKRLGFDPKDFWPFDEKQMFFNQIASSKVMLEDAKSYGPLVTITDADIKEWGVKGKPQQGKIVLKEFLDKGIYQFKRTEGDQYGFICYKDFVKDPENNKLSSASGKFEIYCDAKADLVNNMGFGPAEFKPYANYTVPVEGYETTFDNFKSKTKGEYPYLIYNPHYFRRSHTVFDNVPWLREAWTQPIFISASDAAEKGIKDGDTVLIWNKHGKVLRNASVVETLVPGVLALPHGAWIDIDEATGIDVGGADNVLCGPTVSGIAVSGYNNYNCNFKKYEGKPLIPDCNKPQRIVDLK